MISSPALHYTSPARSGTIQSKQFSPAPLWVLGSPWSPPSCRCTPGWQLYFGFLRNLTCIFWTNSYLAVEWSTTMLGFYDGVEAVRVSWPNQCVTVPKIMDDTDTDTFFRYQIFSIPIPVLFLVPNFSDTGSETFSDTKFFWYRFRDFFPVPIFVHECITV